ncbi:KAP family P-loop NTPase fold protein [Serratia entomophila]|uniref:KAP family P-loop NTPase fold protein n=1 Tax=Serratia entomophila TaxID=42906 RepID=UPI00217787C3|nr:KAP family NTPase [Serratia entomophila]CAI1631339.1 Predicted P-loop ATPase [Serratia entomophila]
MKKDNFELDWDWSKSIDVFFDDEFETFPPDQLERRKYAEYLYFYLKEMGSKDNTVINLNAEWGAGKTFFVKRMYNSLKNHHPCIYIDAWKQDFSDDAFLTIFSSLISQIERYSGKIDARLIRTMESIGRFTKGVIPEILSGLINRYGGIENVADVAKSAAELMLTEHQEKMKAIAKLKKELKFWGELSFKKGYSPPIFIFIDELDRCRPDYAISILEIVKHIFNIDKFVFVVATDTDQLQHSVKNVYGLGFEANDYLSRFFHRRFSLKAPDLLNLVHQKISFRINDEFNNSIKNLIPIPSNIEDLSYNISQIFKSYRLNLRDSLRNLDRFLDLIISRSFKKNMDYVSLLILMIMYDKDNNSFNHITQKSVRHEKIENTLSTSPCYKKYYGNEIELIIDNSEENNSVNYMFTDNYRRNNDFVKNKISTTIYEFMTIFCTFLEHRNEEIKLLDHGHPKFLTIRNVQNIYPEEYIKFYMGASIAVAQRNSAYGCNDYASFIEMATAFD